MTRYRVTIAHDACTSHDVDAKTKNAAVTAAFGECSVSLCHHCSDQIELADPIRAVIVENLETGESDDEVDPPHEVVSLRARVDALTAQQDRMRSLLRESMASVEFDFDLQNLLATKDRSDARTERIQRTGALLSEINSLLQETPA